MKTIIRNFLSVVRRYNVAATLNVLGLSVAFAAFIVIMVQVRYEQTFDRCHPNSDLIYRVDLKQGDGDATPILPRAMVDALLESSPYIKEGTLFNPWLGKLYVTVGDSLDRRGFREQIATCYPSMTRVFGFGMVEGEADCMNEPDKALIPLSMAQRLFGDSPATGRLIEAKENIWTKFGIRKLTVGGVYRDFPENTQLNNVIYSSIDDTQQGSWSMRNFICYIRFETQSAARSFESETNASFDFGPAQHGEHVDMSFKLMPLHDIYYSGGDVSVAKTGDSSTMKIIFCIAIMVILIAAINFTNFSIALAPMRIRSINTQKILGSSVMTLRVALTLEAVIIALVSWAVSLLIVYALNRYSLLSFIDAKINADALPVIMLTGAIAIVAGFVAGLYPARYITSFQPAMALKGSFAMSPSGRMLRTGLIGFQYIISAGLIIGAIFIQLQNSYMRDSGAGFAKDHIALVSIGGDMLKNYGDLITTKIRSYPDVEDIAFASHRIGSTDTYSQYNYKYKGTEEFYAHTIAVSHNFLDLMQVSILEGRNFTASEQRSGAKPVFIVNRILNDEINIGAGGTLDMPAWGDDNCPVVGVTGEVKINSARQNDYPAVFVLNSPIAFPQAYIRIKAGADVSEAVAHIRETFAAADPTYPVDVEFYDSVIDNLYHKENNLNLSITLLSILAIIISIVGVFGLVMFETQYRRKEISIRKIHGATAGSILVMFNRVYMRIVLVCFALAAPFAWYAVSRWLENFACKTPLYWWVFALALVIIAAVTVATVTFQNWRAANMNPAENIKSE